MDCFKKDWLSDKITTKQEWLRPDSISSTVQRTYLFRPTTKGHCLLSFINDNLNQSWQREQLSIWVEVVTEDPSRVLCLVAHRFPCLCY